MLLHPVMHCMLRTAGGTLQSMGRTAGSALQGALPYIGGVCKTGSCAPSSAISIYVHREQSLQVEARVLIQSFGIYKGGKSLFSRVCCQENNTPTPFWIMQLIQRDYWEKLGNGAWLGRADGGTDRGKEMQQCTPRCSLSIADEVQVRSSNREGSPLLRFAVFPVITFQVGNLLPAVSRSALYSAEPSCALPALWIPQQRQENRAM